MPSNTRYSGAGFSISRPPDGVKWLLLSNAGVWLLNVLCALTGLGVLFFPFALTPDLVVKHGYIWQVVTYMFLHSTHDPLHILFNMLALWMFGAEIERAWGTRRFLKYYFICGVGAAICVIVVALLFGQGDVPTLGASGAIYGLLLAFGLMFPDVTVFFLVFPIKAKYLVIIMGALAFFFSVSGGNSGVSNVAHLGGLLIGYVYLRAPLLKLDAIGLRQRRHEWKMNRARRKFEVYMRKQDSKREPWVH